MERKSLNNGGSSDTQPSIHLGTASPDITRMMTPTLSDDKTEDISLDFSKFETDTMLHSTYHHDRDIDRSPDPTCLQLQSPLDLSITTSFENSLSDCGVGSCFDSAKTAYSFSSTVNSTESDSFVHIDEALPIDTLSKPQVNTLMSKSVPLNVTNPPVILGNIGAANFVTAVLNKNLNQQQVLNNMILPSTSIAMNTPSIFVLNPCGLVNLIPPVTQPDVEVTTSSIISMCPPPIKSILSLLTSKPQNIVRDNLNLTTMEPQIISFPQHDTSVTDGTTQTVTTDQCNVTQPGVISLDSQLNAAAVQQPPEQLSPVNLSCSAASATVVDISDIPNTEDNDEEDDYDMPAENQADEVDGDEDVSQTQGPDQLDDIDHDVSANDMQSDKAPEQNERDSILNEDTMPVPEADMASTSEPNQDSLPEEPPLKKKRPSYGNRQKKEKVNMKCDLCSATFTKAGNYYRHRKIHSICTESEDTRYTCSQCDRKFLQKCDLKRHTLIHMKQEPFRCEVCQKGYIRNSDLKVHTRFHTRERSHPCDKCDKKFFQSGDLNRHKRHVHKEKSPLTCGHCKKGYASEATLIRHMQANHRELILRSLNEKIQTQT